MRYSIGIATAALFCLLPSALSCAHGGQSEVSGRVWSYSDMAGSAGDIVIAAGVGKASIGHVAVTGEFCNATQPFACFEVAGISFAVPQKLSGTKLPTSWTHKGRTYTASQSPRRLVVFGHTFDVVEIRLASSDPAMRFLYSLERGLLGIQGESNELTPFFVIQQQCGFAAPMACYD